MSARSVCALCLVLGPAISTAQPALLVEGRPADRVVLTIGPESPAEVSDRTPMANELRGILGLLKGPEARVLSKAGQNATGWPSETEPIAWAHLHLAGDVRHAELGRTPDGIYLARIPSTAYAPEEVWMLRPAPIKQLESFLTPYRTRPTGWSPNPGAVEDFPAPLIPSRITLNDQTLRDRRLQSRYAVRPETTRDPAAESLWIRLPAAWNDRSRPGLLLWVNAASDGAIPDVLWPAADELGLVIVAPKDCGNDRPVTDRYQLALDALATIPRSLRIDPDRVYVAGISGGGRVSTSLAVCFPDIFRGAVPVVGLSCHALVPRGDGSAWPPGHEKPGPAMWRLARQSRIAPLTGPPDFNYQEIIHASRILDRDGLTIRVFEHEHLAHELPSAEQFAEALAWVDEPIRHARAEASEHAGTLLDGVLKRFAEAPAADPARRAALEDIIARAPWSEPAWRACELLDLPLIPSD